MDDLIPEAMTFDFGGRVERSVKTDGQIEVLFYSTAGEMFAYQRGGASDSNSPTVFPHGEKPVFFVNEEGKDTTVDSLAKMLQTADQMCGYSYINATNICEKYPNKALQACLLQAVSVYQKQKTKANKI